MRTVLLKCILQFSDDISFGTYSHGVPAKGVGGGPVAEPIVMLACKHEISKKRASCYCLRGKRSNSSLLGTRFSHDVCNYACVEEFHGEHRRKVLVGEPGREVLLQVLDASPVAVGLIHHSFVPEGGRLNTCQVIIPSHTRETHLHAKPLLSNTWHWVRSKVHKYADLCFVIPPGKRTRV